MPGMHRGCTPSINKTLLGSSALPAAPPRRSGAWLIAADLLQRGVAVAQVYHAAEVDLLADVAAGEIPVLVVVHGLLVELAIRVDARGHHRFVEGRVLDRRVLDQD